VRANDALANLDLYMNPSSSKYTIAAGLLALALLLPETASAFRCGNKLVKDGMHEVEVLAICGEPTLKRNLGYAIRGVDIRAHRPSLPGWTITRSPGYYTYPAEVMVTEYVYNLGPRKLMRRLVFEGGLLVSVDTLGRGYRD
jgi:hypothetical protein